MFRAFGAKKRISHFQDPSRMTASIVMSKKHHSVGEILILDMINIDSMINCCFHVGNNLKSGYDHPF